MRIGFDIDDTLINLREHAFHIYNRKLNKNVNIEEFRKLKTLEINKAFDLDIEDGNRMWIKLHEEIYFSDCSAFEGAKEFVNQLKEEGHEIFYITARPKGHCSRTMRWMIENGFPVVENHFYCGMQDHEKIDIIKQLKLDYYFDDKPTVLATLSDLNTKVCVKDQSYNRHLTIPRVIDWKDFKIE